MFRRDNRHHNYRTYLPTYLTCLGAPHATHAVAKSRRRRRPPSRTIRMYTYAFTHKDTRTHAHMHMPPSNPHGTRPPARPSTRQDQSIPVTRYPSIQASRVLLLLRRAPPPEPPSRRRIEAATPEPDAIPARKKKKERAAPRFGCALNSIAPMQRAQHSNGDTILHNPPQARPSRVSRRAPSKQGPARGTQTQQERRTE